MIISRTIEKLDLKILIQEAAGLNKSAQKIVFERYYGFVLSITLRYMANRSEAEEMLNDTFLKVFQNLKKYDVSQEFKNWVSAICVNTCIDRLRKLKNKPKLVELNLEDLSHSEFQELLFDDDKPVLPIIQSLPPQYRAVFNLYVFEGYKHREISEILGISEGTSKSNYSRAKVFLKKKLLMDKKLINLRKEAL